MEREAANLNFAQFREQVRLQLPLYDVITSTVKLKEQSGVQTEVRFRLQPYLDGKRWSSIPEISHNAQPLVLGSDDVIDSPVLKLTNGILTIK